MGCYRQGSQISGGSLSFRTGIGDGEAALKLLFQTTRCRLAAGLGRSADDSRHSDLHIHLFYPYSFACLDGLNCGDDDPAAVEK